MRRENEEFGNEKLIALHGHATVAIGTLERADFRFDGEPHPETAVLHIHVDPKN